MLDAFISYSRTDKPFVERLVQMLTAAGRGVWVDFADIPFATDWWAEIQTGIEASSSVVFVISPDALESRYCGLEVNHAQNNNKRLIPIVCRRPGATPVPSHISSLNWIFFDDPAQFETSVQQLLTTLDTDVESERQLTRLLLRAKAWAARGHSDSLLLRGDELAELYRLRDAPNLTALQRSYLDASHEEDLRTRMIWRFQWAFLGGLAGIAVWAFSTFRSDVLITPLRVIYTLALGQVFGLGVGLMAALVGDVTRRIQRLLPGGAVTRIALCLALGVLAWASYLWFLENLNLTSQDIATVVFGGLGLAAGFILRVLFKMPGWTAFLLMAILTYIPIYMTFNRFFAGSEQFISLVLFDDPDQLFSVAAPMVLLIALGANAQDVYRDVHRLYRRWLAPRTE